MEEKTERATVLGRELRFLEETRRSAEEERLVSTFGSYLPPADVLSDTENRVQEYTRVEREYHALPTTITTTATVQRTERQKPTAYIVTAIIAVVLLLAGIALLGVSTGVGVALAVVGAILLLGDAFAYLNKKTSVPEVQTVETENPEKRKKEAELRSLEYAVRAVLTHCGYHSEKGLAFDFECMKKDVDAYLAYAEKERARSAEIANKRDEAKATEWELSVFFTKYGVVGNSFMSCLNTLGSDISSYENLLARKQSATADVEKLQEALQNNRVEIEAYRRKYRVETDGVPTAIEDAREAERLLREEKTMLARAQAYKEEKGLTEKPQEERVDTEALHAELSLLRAKQSRLALEIEEDEAIADSLGGYEADKADAEERLAEYKIRHKLLTATAGFLQEAEQNLKNKYVKPIKDEFVKYAVLLEEALGEKVSLSRNFEVSFERSGKERSERHLSSGQRSICALCFRLALVRNMYKDQTPFLVLDDPFTALDDNHLRRVLALVDALAEDMQIVYFVCHESRTKQK
jgi:DNA repair exonuclease SbcCD ATPase subunit